MRTAASWLCSCLRVRRCGPARVFAGLTSRPRKDCCLRNAASRRNASLDDDAIVFVMWASPSTRNARRTWLIAVRRKRAPRLAPGARAQTTGCSLPADLEAASTTRGAGAGVTAGDNLDPERILALVVRGGAGLAQCIQAVLLRTRGCGGESRQLKDHPRAA